MTGGEGREEEEGKTKDRSIPDGSDNNNYKVTRVTTKVTGVTRGDGTEGGEEGKGEGGEREEEGGEEIGRLVGRSGCPLDFYYY